VAASATSNDVTFVTAPFSSSYYYAGYDCFDCGYYGGSGTQPLPLVVLGGIQSRSFSNAVLDIDGGDYWYSTVMVASGNRALLSAGWRGALSVVDASDAAHPEVVREVRVHGYVQDIDVSGDFAVTSMGMDGSGLIDISQ
jgi:hypothetical protein